MNQEDVYVRNVSPILRDVSKWTADGPITLTWTFQLAGSADSFNPVQILLMYYGDNEFTLSQPQPMNFRPRDSRDAPATSGCDRNPNDCYPTIWAGVPLREPLFWSDPAMPDATVTFTLKLPSYMNGKWLRGSSSNFGADTENAPDYIFEAAKNTKLSAPSKNGLSISLTTNDHATWAGGVPAVVSSRDYGGVANVRAELKFMGQTYQADVTAGDAPGFQPPIAGCAEKDSYSQLPIDRDCNGIADSWEGQYTTPAGGHLDPKGDAEFGVGDGLTNLDEYRGIHYYNTALSSQRWMSTDPIAKLDAFYIAEWNWPDGRPVANSVDSQDQAGDFTAMLARETPTAAFHRVREGYDGVAIEIARGRVNKNSPGNNAAYPIEYHNASGSATGTVLGNAQVLNNDGSKPILIFPVTIAAKSASLNFPLALLQDETVAHETGHRLGLVHPTRGSSAVDFDAKQLSALALDQFSIDPAHPARVYSQYKIYSYTAPKFVSGETVYLAPFHLKVKSETPHGAVPAPAYNVESEALYQIRASGPLDIKTQHLLVETQIPAIMDWTPRLTLQTSVQWHFTPSDLQALCVKPVSCH